MLYPENSFDAIICQHVIEHLISPMPMVHAFKKVLKNDGVLFIETPNWTRLFAPFSHFFFWNDYTHVRIYTTFSMRKLFQEHSFIIRQIVTVSSCQWIVPGDSLEKVVKRVKEPSKKDEEKNAPESKSLAGRITARLLNPLMKDVLIAVVVNKK
jgi:SAM-dependent methyltransferase